LIRRGWYRFFSGFAKPFFNSLLPRRQISWDVLLRRAVQHQLEIEPVREQAHQLGQRRLGGVGLALRDKPADQALASSGSMRRACRLAALRDQG
jgi:hypothetical protein